MADTRFEIYEDVSGNYRWRLISAGGLVTAVSGQAFPSADAAKRSAEALKQQSSDASIVREAV
jgi:uncharacterized protein YegP (UPF0339 family)